MPSPSQGVLGISHADMVKCLCSIVQLVEDLLVEFKQESCKPLSEWKDKVVIDVDAFNLQSKTELLHSLDEKCLALTSWLQNDLYKVLLPTNNVVGSPSIFVQVILSEMHEFWFIYLRIPCSLLSAIL